VELVLIVAIVSSYLGIIDDHVTDLALIGIVQELRQADGMILPDSGALNNELPEAYETGDHEDPDQNLFDGGVQLHFLVFYLYVRRPGKDTSELADGLAHVRDG
jgi:hypothetical protein